jgi:hypothetical protein
MKSLVQGAPPFALVDTCELECELFFRTQITFFQKSNPFELAIYILILFNNDHQNTDSLYDLPTVSIIAYTLSLSYTL